MKQRRFHSHATSPGIAIGKAYLFRRGITIPHYWLRDKEVPKEIKRFQDAVGLARLQLSKIQTKLCRIQGGDQIKIIESYRLFLQDDLLIHTTIRHIEEMRMNAEWALEKTLANLKLSFLNLEEHYFRERRQDIEYVGQRLMENLMGLSENGLTDLPHGEVVLIAHDLSPAEMVMLSRERVVGVIMESGGDTSHTAIIARALEIPAAFGVTGALDSIQNGEIVILDGMKGLAIASPFDSELDQYRTIQQKYAALEELLLKDIHLPAETKDGSHLRLEANIELVDEVPSAIRHGAEGVGLYRTEFLFLNRMDEPSEEEQFSNYVQVLKQFHPKPVTIRTIDIGGDKLRFAPAYNKEENPALGLRAVRLCLREIELFKTQIAALLRASVVGNLHILIPLVSHVDEIIRVKTIIHEVKRTLKAHKQKFQSPIPLGVMIEVPAAVVMAREIAREVDFFSVGTNDLLQYSLAIDRSNELVSNLFTPYHPALFRMLKEIVKGAEERRIPVALCGELAADPLALPVLIGMGFDSLSMNAVSIPRVKKILRALKRSDAKKLSHEILTFSTAAQVEKRLRQEVAKKMPLAIQKFGFS